MVLLGAAADLEAQVGRRPTAPAKLTAAAGQDGAVRLNWADRSSNEQGFRITRQPAFPGGDVTVGANVTTFTDTPGAGTFSYRVAAFNSAGTSSYTSAARVSASGTSSSTGTGGGAGPDGLVTPNPGGQIYLGIPAAPSHLAATPSSNQVLLTWWDHADNEIFFNIEKQVQVGQQWQNAEGLHAWIDNVSIVDPVGPGTYRYRIRACQFAGCSSFTDWVTVSVIDLTTPPAAPSGLSASDAGSGRALVSWTDNSNNETSFKLERNPAFASGVITLNANVTSYIDDCGNGSFSYRVRATNAAGTSNPTGWVSVNIASGSTGGGSGGGTGGGGSGGGTEGWTDLTAPAGAQVFYVAASGSDANPGTQAAPFRTIHRGYQALRDGQPDQLLLRCGDSWTLTDQVTITKGGSATNYQVIGSYGSGPRPKISAPQVAFRGESIGKRRIAFTGLDIVCSNPREDSSCIILLGWKDILIEDCHLHEAGYPLVIQGFNTRSSGVRVRRNVITEASYPTSQAHARAVGLYMDLTDDWVIEENVFDKCGITGSMFGRPVYIQSDCSRGTYRENIMSRSCAEGVQVRTGGIVHNNLSLRNPIGMFVGDAQPGTNDVQFNVVVESGDINTTDRRGIGLHIGGPSIVKNNVLGYNTGTGWGSTKGIYLGSVTGECSNNYVFDWTRDPALGGPGDVHEAQGIHLESGSGSITIANNTIFQIRPGIVYEKSSTISVSGSGNRFWWTPGNNQPFRPNSSAPGWTTIGSTTPTDPQFRVQNITGMTLEAFIAEARKQSRQNWRSEFTANGFNTLVRARVQVANPGS